jgi:hypothetical protein
VAGIPVNEALYVEGDASRGKVLGDRVVVAGRVSRPTVALCHPVLVKFNVDTGTSSSCRVNVTIIIAESVRLSVSIPVRIRSAPIDGVVGGRTVAVG